MSEEKKAATTPLEVVSCMIMFYEAHPDRWITGGMKYPKLDTDGVTFVDCFCAVGKMLDCITPGGNPYQEGSREHPLFVETTHEVVSTYKPGTPKRTYIYDLVFELNDRRGFTELMDVLRKTKERLFAATC